MSWSVEMIGLPEKVVEALKAHVDKLGGNSRVEFEDALPHLVGIVSQNFVKDGVDMPQCLVRLVASGAGTVGRKMIGDGLGPFEQIQRSISVKMEQLWGVL